MTIVWIIVGLLTAYLLYGFIMPTPYHKLAVDRLPRDRVDNGYLVPHEVLDPDEGAIAQRVSEALARQRKTPRATRSLSGTPGRWTLQPRSSRRH